MCCLQRLDSKMSGARPEKYQNMMGKYFILIYSMFITARKRSLRRLYFYTCLSVILFTGGMSASVHDGIHPSLLAADTPRKQTPPQVADTPSGSRHPPEADTPPSQCMLGDTGNKRAVCILLEYIFVSVFLPWFVILVLLLFSYVVHVENSTTNFPFSLEAVGKRRQFLSQLWMIYTATVSLERNESDIAFLKQRSVN